MSTPSAPPLPDEPVPLDAPPLPDEPLPSLDKGKGRAVTIETDDEVDEVEDADDGPEPVWHRPEDEGTAAPPLPASPPTRIEPTTAGAPPPLPNEAPPLPDDAPPAAAGAIKKGDWAAVWSPQMNAYFFYNSKTKQTTWDNPLEPKPEASGSQPSALAPEPSTRDFGGIDPDLAYLDPTLQFGPRAQIQGAHAARFNSRTGRFEGDPERNPDSVSEHSRMRKQSAFFFDMDGWESQRAQEQAALLAQGKDPSLKAARREVKLTKAELEYFKNKGAAAKRKRQTEWLLNDDGRESRGPGAKRR